MVSVHSREQFLFLQKITQNLYTATSSFWIGGRRNKTNSTLFQWMDGSLWDYSPWASGHPVTGNAHDCVHMNTQMWSYPCTADHLHQLCQKKARKNGVCIIDTYQQQIIQLDSRIKKMENILASISNVLRNDTNSV
ncbi:ladderlectin-like protein [Leptotrombidium deliense]|uniref:Ladderlectin-like protein n=1 Tax=Leptotrombidium deliense TaxID=299467 RepID=A0A443S7E8_9ACAR|nr:ladderlectin-like protein [Leptotrombidium deliense]